MRARRFSTKEFARLQVYGRMESLIAKMKNLSSTGACLELVSGDYVPQKGDIIHFIVDLQDISKSYEMNGEVKWNDGLGFGISFVKKNELMSKIVQRN